MELNRNSRLVRWAYQGIDGAPSQTSLCVFFWRAFVLVPLAWAGLIIFASLFVYAVGKATWHTKGMFPLIVTVGLLFIYQISEPSSRFRVFLYNRKHNPSKRKPPSVFIQGLKTIKGKVCPIIHIR